MNADRDGDRNPAEGRVESPSVSSEAIMITTPELEPQPSAAEAANPVVEADLVAGVGQPRAEEGQKRRRINLGMDRFSGLYVWAALIILFSFWVPDTFPTTDNAKIIDPPMPFMEEKDFPKLPPFLKDIEELIVLERHLRCRRVRRCGRPCSTVASDL
jgi:hypothetical protein